MEPAELDMQVTCGHSGEKENIKIVFKQSDKYDPEYESELIKYIKSKNILDETDIRFINGYIFSKSGSMVIDEPDHRDNAYKFEYIRKRDKITEEKLSDDDQIEFVVINENTETVGIKYKEYFDDIKNETNKIILKNSEEIVLESSEFNLCFNYPTLNQVIFSIKAPDPVKGFSRKELADIIFRYYHMQYFISMNYDSKKGEINLSNGDGIFASIFPFEYEENGIYGIEYNKDKKIWQIGYMNYI